MIALAQGQVFEEFGVCIHSIRRLRDIKNVLEERFPGNEELIENMCRELQKKCRTTNDKRSGILLHLNQQNEEVKDEAIKLLNFNI